MTIATAPRIESPLPYPSAAYIVGANSGKPNPAHERRNVTAASAAGRGQRARTARGGRLTGRGVQREGVDDVRLDGLEVEDGACADERDALGAVSGEIGRANV